MSDQLDNHSTDGNPVTAYERTVYYGLLVILYVLVITLFIMRLAPPSVLSFLHLPVVQNHPDQKSAQPVELEEGANSSRSPRALEFVVDSYFRLNQFDKLRSRWATLATPIVNAQKWQDDETGRLVELLVEGNVVSQNFSETKGYVDRICELTMTSDFDGTRDLSPKDDTFGQVYLRQILDRNVERLTEAIKRLEIYIDSGTVPSEEPL